VERYVHALYSNRLEAVKADGQFGALFVHEIFEVQAMADHMRSGSVPRLVLQAMVAALEQECRADLIKTYMAEAKTPQLGRLCEIELTKRHLRYLESEHQAKEEGVMLAGSDRDL
jgi:hypothetical protein